MAIGEGWNLNQPVNNFVLHPLGSIVAIKLTGTGPTRQKIVHIALYCTLCFLSVQPLNWLNRSFVDAVCGDYT